MVGSEATGGGDLTVSNSVTLWNGLTWEIADPHLSSMGGVDHNNIAFHFAKQLQEDTGENVRIVLDPIGGTAISAWVGSGKSSSQYSSWLGKARCGGVTSVDYVLWHQADRS